NDLVQVFKRAVTQASAFYLLGYSKDMPMDGKFHPIKVRVKRRGVEVRSRSGYWAPLAADMARARETAARNEVSPAVSDALSVLTGADARRSIEVWAGVGPAAGGQRRVTVAWLPRSQPGESPAKPAEASVSATLNGVPVFDGRIEQGGTSFEAPPGPLRLVTTVRSADGEVVDRDTRRLDVPAPATTLAVE